ncbi:Flp family type IVb pilin [Candidatus Nomurabacteria bacterium]|nr:Flp family type IVb pilin [Candidatus Nomurabacteria bacterium]
MKLINRFIKSESGATAIEYGLIAAIIAVAIIGAVSAFGPSGQ